MDLNSSFFVDEATWVARGYFVELILKGQINHPYWHTYGSDGDTRLASYFYGLALYPDYLKAKAQDPQIKNMFQFLTKNYLYDPLYLSPAAKLEPGNTTWNFTEQDSTPWPKLIQLYGDNFRETVRLVLKARIVGVFFMSLAVTTAFFIAMKINGSVIMAVLTSVIYGLSHLPLTYGTVAYSDPVYLFFFNLTLLLLIQFFTEKKNLSYNWALAFGFFAAISTQTKLSGIILLICFIILYGLHLLKKRQLIWKPLALTVATYVLVYYLMNPSSYSQPLKFTLFQFSWTHNNSLYVQNHSSWALFDESSRINYLRDNLFNPWSTYLFPVDLWPNFWLGGWGRHLFIVGLIIGLIKGFKKLLERRLTSVSIITLIALIHFLLILKLLVVGWGRYWITLILPMLVLVNDGILTLIRFTVQQAASRRKK